jgi:hypothetical protein
LAAFTLKLHFLCRRTFRGRLAREIEDTENGFLSDTMPVGAAMSPAVEVAPNGEAMISVQQ